MKKLVALVLAVMLCMSLAVASAEVEINFWGGWTGSDAGVWQSMVDTFNQSQTDVHVNLTLYGSWSDMFAKLVTEYTDGQPADVMGVHPFEIGQYANMGLYNADQVAAMGLNPSDYSDAVWAGTMYNGTQYAVPFDSHMHGLYYNKDIFEKNGIEKVPTTGEELIETAIALTVDENGLHPNEEGFDASHVSQYGLSFAMNHHSIFQWCTLMYQQGETPFTEDMTEVTFNTEKAEKAFQWIQDLIYKYRVAPQGETSYSDSFVNGRAAMVIGGSWDVPKFNAAGLNYGTALYPQVFNGAVGYWASAHLLVFPASKKPDAAKQGGAVAFVKWLCDNSNTWADAGYVTTKLSSQEYVKTLENVSMWLDVLDKVHYMPAHEKASQLFNQSAPSPFVTAYSSMIQNQGNVHEGVTQFVKDLNDVLAD